MTNKSYSHILDDVAGDQVPQSLDLAPNILNRIQKRKGITMQFRTRMLFAVLTFVIVLAALVATVPGVAAAIGRWFGYVPGVGLVREGQVRVLAEPVRMIREGVTVTVEQGMIDSERTSLVYSVDGIPNRAVAGGAGQPCSYLVGLRLPDGSELKASPNGLQYWGTGYQQRFNYAALPATVNDAVLEISCLYETLPGAAPENWEIPLHFVASSSAVTAYPVIEIPAASATAIRIVTAAASPAATLPAGTSAVTPQAQAIHLTLDRAVQMDDGYLIYATLHWEDSAYLLVETLDLSETLHLSTAGGQEIAFEEYFDEQTGVRVDQRQTIFAIKTAPIQMTDPLILTLDWVSVNLETHASFVFDPGASPTNPVDSPDGQTWMLNQNVQVGEHTLIVRSASAGYGGFNFEMTSVDGIINATLVDLDHPVVSGGGGGSGSPGDAFFFNVNYDGALPQKPVTITISSIAVKLDLNLQAEWTPPAASIRPLPTQAAACLTANAWKAAQARPAALPAGLNGRVLTGQYFEEMTQSMLTISDLDGSNPRTIANAESGAFSPDGTKLAYSRSGGGISILDLATNQTAELPGTGKGDINPTWTPDSRQIVFNRGMGIFDLFIANPDGTDLHNLTSGGLQEWQVGWLVDGRLLYQVPGREDEYTVTALNLQTGAAELFSNENIDSISPDGKKMLTLEKTFGDRWLTYVSAIDGADRWLLADSSLWVLTPTWSPDGQWLLAGVSDTDAGSTVGALIHLSPCEVIALPELKGSVEGWK